MAGSSDGAQGQVEKETGGSVPPPTSTPIEPPGSEGIASCRDKIRTPGSAGGSGGGDTIDFQIFTPNNKEKCIIYSETHDCPIEDQILTDKFGTEYNIQGCPAKSAIFWYNRVSNGPFTHSESFPIFVPGEDSQEPSIPPITDTGGGSVTIGGDNPDGSISNNGRTNKYKILKGVSNPRIDYDVHSDRLRLAYGSSGTSLYTTVGDPKPIFFRRLASEPKERNKAMPFTTMYIFGIPRLLMEKTVCGFVLGTSSPPAAEKDDLAKGVVCDTDGPDCGSSSTKIFTGDLQSMGDFDDLTIVTSFTGGSKGNFTSPASTAKEMVDGTRSAVPDRAVTATPSQAQSPGVGVMRWMLWLNQNKNYQDVDTGRGGMVYQSESSGGGSAPSPQGSNDTGKKPEITGQNCEK